MYNFSVQYFPDIIGGIVENIQKDSLPRWDYGWFLEQSNKLKLKGTNPSSIKLPLIFMPLPFTENHNSNGVYYSENSFSLYLMAFASRNKSSKERYDTNFKNTLYPIYQNLINEMKINSSIHREGEEKRYINHTMRVLPIYNAEVNGNIFSTPVDVIRLDFNDIKINKVSNCINN